MGKREGAGGVSGRHTSRRRGRRKKGGCGSRTMQRRGSGVGVVRQQKVKPDAILERGDYRLEETGLTSSWGCQARHFTSCA